MKGKLVILQWRIPAKYHLTQVIERNIISNARDQYVVMMLKKNHTHTHTQSPLCQNAKIEFNHEKISANPKLETLQKNWLVLFKILEVSKDKRRLRNYRKNPRDISTICSIWSWSRSWIGKKTLIFLFLAIKVCYWENCWNVKSVNLLIVLYQCWFSDFNELWLHTMVYVIRKYWSMQE